MTQPKVMSFAAFARVYIGYIRPHKNKALGLLVLLGVDVAFKTTWPLSFKFLIDHALVRHDQRVLFGALAGLMCGVVVATLCSVIRDSVYAFLSARLVHDLRTRAFSHLQRLPLKFYDRTRTGDIMGRFSTDLVTVENSLSWVVASMILNGTNVLVSAAVLLVLEWRLAVLTIFGLILCVVLPRRFSHRAGEIGYGKKVSEAEMGNGLQENVTSQPVVRAFGLEQQSIGHFLRQSIAWASLARRFYFFSNLVERTPNAVILITEVAVMGGGILLIFYGHLTLGTVIAFHALFLNLSSSVEGMTAVLPPLLQSIGGVQRLEELLSEPTEDGLETLESSASQTSPLQRGISFDHVTFSYTGGQPSLIDVTLDIRKGSFVALVGGSGSGKSTVLNLLLRFYDCQEGSILMDDRNVRSVPRAMVRSQVGAVFQENFLFNISIRENIRFGKPDASDADIEAAARHAEIHDAIMQFSQGYDTLVGERGSRLSGGQRQRIAIARALIRDPSILILDEATSALDSATEEAINATLQRIAVGRTVISVTHRLSSITRADRVHVFEAGKVIESGSHQELLNLRGHYANLWQKQSGFMLDSDDHAAGILPARLRRYPVLQELEEELLSELAGVFVTESYAADRVVVQQGEPGDRFYIIVRGRVRVSETQHDGSERSLAILDDGDHFGEVALLKDAPRNATITTLVPSVFLSLRRQQFKLLVERAPQIRLNLRQASPPEVSGLS